MICGIGGAIACVDLFDHPETLLRLYPRLVRSYALDALGIHKGEVEAATGQRFVESAAHATMTNHPGVGMGHELRLTGQDVVGSALVAGMQGRPRRPVSSEFWLRQGVRCVVISKTPVRVPRPLLAGSKNDRAGATEWCRTGATLEV